MKSKQIIFNFWLIFYIEAIYYKIDTLSVIKDMNRDIYTS